MNTILPFFLFLFWANLAAQTILPQSYYRTDTLLTAGIAQIVEKLKINGSYDCAEDGLEQISLAVIIMGDCETMIAGYNMDNFIYPASVYKMYVAGAVLSQISEGKHSLYDQVIVKDPNVVDRSKEIKTDPRPLLKDGDTVTINYLLDLMITRSDNSAANCLIDMAKRPAINDFMHKYGWFGSEVTRKYLKRKFEDPGYDTVRGTETCALHAADFMYRIYNNELENPWVSMQMQALLGRQLDKSKLAQGLPPDAMFYHKTGWFSFWTHDVGIVDDGESSYIIACFLPIEETKAKPIMKELAYLIHNLVKKFDYRE